MLNQWLKYPFLPGDGLSQSVHWQGSKGKFALSLPVLGLNKGLQSSGLSIQHLWKVLAFWSINTQLFLWIYLCVCVAGQAFQGSRREKRAQPKSNHILLSTSVSSLLVFVRTPKKLGKHETLLQGESLRGAWEWGKKSQGWRERERERGGKGAKSDNPDLRALYISVILTEINSLKDTERKWRETAM